MLAAGQGCEKNDEEAVKWLRASAERGNKKAQLSLAKMYRAGRGVAQSEAEANFWEQKAAGANPQPPAIAPPRCVSEEF